MLTFLFGILAELFLLLIVEALFELGLHSVAEVFQRRPNQWIAGVGYLLLGAGCGGASLLLFPAHMVVTPSWRIANLVVIPIAAGLCMAALGAWRARRGKPVLRIDRFIYGYLFALAFALVRFAFAD